MSNYEILSTINSPADVKKLNAATRSKFGS